VRLDISVDDLQLVQQAQRKQHLFGIAADSGNGDTNTCRVAALSLE
jgi:hypothetical protein